LTWFLPLPASLGLYGSFPESSSDLLGPSFSFPSCFPIPYVAHSCLVHTGRFPSPPSPFAPKWANVPKSIFFCCPNFLAHPFSLEHCPTNSFLCVFLLALFYDGDECFSPRHFSLSGSDSSSFHPPPFCFSFLIPASLRRLRACFCPASLALFSSTLLTLSLPDLSFSSPVLICVFPLGPMSPCFFPCIFYPHLILAFLFFFAEHWERS